MNIMLHRHITTNSQLAVRGRIQSLKNINRLSARKTSVNHGQNKNVAPNETTTCNQFNILSHSEENNVKLDAVIDGSNELTSPSVTKQKLLRVDFSKHNEQGRNNQLTKSFKMGKNKASFNDTNRTDTNRVSTCRGGESDKLVFIAGDSILQHVHGWEVHGWVFLGKYNRRHERLFKTSNLQKARYNYIACGY